MRCPACGFENPEGMRFCGECAAPLTALEAERRQLTVLFADIVGSTALSSRLDPEEYRQAIRAYQQAFAEVIHPFEGHIAQYQGDGILAYFGYPAAHEDDAHRAARAGLGILEAIQGVNPLLQQEVGSTVAIRVGIHTGLVVVGEMGGGAKREHVAVGETTNVAARIQTLAEPDTVVISDATYRLLRGLFTFEDLGAHSVKGLAQAIRLYRVLEETGTQERLELAGAGLTPLVGRENEADALMERWQDAKEGRTQVVLLDGESGIGKTRLVQVMRERVAGEPHALLQGNCSPYHRNSALYPVIDLLNRALGLRADDSPGQKLSKLEAGLAQDALPLEGTVPLLASLLSLPLSAEYTMPALTPQAQRQKILESLVAWLLARSRREPVMLILENLHWVDPSTLELLEILIGKPPAARLLTLLTFRPDFRPPWGPLAQLTEISLRRLTRDQTSAMVTRVAGDRILPPEVLHQIVANTDGVPLFIEELTKMLLESGWLRQSNGHFALTGPLPPLAIPPTLQDSLMARLDRLGTTKAVAQLCATIGRAFRHELLQAVSPLDDAALRRELARLVEAELIFQEGAPPEATYIFKHALIQEAAYQSLLRSSRQQYHQRIAQVLAERFPHVGETQPELLAHHFTGAGLNAQAVAYWHQAGFQALQRSANLEAIAHLTRGMELVKVLPETPERLGQELLLQATLGPALIATKGFGAADVGEVYARAREISQQLGGTPQLFPAVWGQWVFYLVRAELQTARELAQEMVRLGESVRDPALLVEGHWTLGDTLFWMGEFESARDHLAQASAVYNPEQHRTHAFLYGQDPGVSALIYASFTSWFLGYPDLALEQSRQALTMAREMAHPFTIAWALGCGAFLRVLRRDVEGAHAMAEETVEFAAEQLHPFWLGAGKIIRGWAMAHKGRGPEGIQELREGLAIWQATGSELVQPAFIGLLADAQGETGQAEQGLAALDEALSKAQDTGEGASEIDLYRLKGELLLKVSAKNAVEAEMEFQRALDMARARRAKSRELQAVMSLSRLWETQGKSSQARAMLAQVYAGFTEGLETADLRDARAMLARLE